VVGAGRKGAEAVSRELELELVVEHYRHLRRSHVGVGEQPCALKALGLHGARSRNALAQGSQRLAQPLTGQLLTPEPSQEDMIQT